MTRHVCFGFRLDETMATKAYLRGLRKKLRVGTQLFRGDVRRLEKGLYVLGLEMLVELSVFLSIWMVMAGISLALLLFGLHTPALIVFSVGTILFLLVALFYSPEFYRLVVYVQCSRASKRHIWVKSADNEVLWELVNA